MTDRIQQNLLIPNRPQVGDRFSSVQWSDAITNELERLSQIEFSYTGGLQLHYCKLAGGALQPSGMSEVDADVKQVDADVFSRSNTGEWLDTGHDVKITNRSRGYYYQNSFVQVIRHPASGEWHIIYPAGDLVIGKTDGALAAGGTATLSIYSWNGSSWADTTHNITIRDVFQWAVSANKFVAARLWDYQNLWIPIAAEC